MIKGRVYPALFFSEKPNESKKKGNLPSGDLLKAIDLAKSGDYKEALSICKKIRPANINNAKY